MASHRIVILVKSFFLRCAVKKVALSHWFVRKARGLGKWFAHWFASLIGCAAFYVVLRIVPDADISHMVDKINELHLACAGLIGTIFALVLSLSIIPAQRAADAFSPAIRLDPKEEYGVWREKALEAFRKKDGKPESSQSSGK